MRFAKKAALWALAVVLGLFAAGLIDQSAGSHSGLDLAYGVLVLLVAVGAVIAASSGRTHG